MLMTRRSGGVAEAIRDAKTRRAARRVIVFFAILELAQAAALVFLATR